MTLPSKLRPVWLIAILLSCAGPSICAQTATFGDVDTSNGWLDQGLVDGANSPQTAIYRDSLSSPLGDIVFTLTVNSSSRMKVVNNLLGVRAGSKGWRIDSRSASNSGDDEWIRFELAVSGAGAADLSSLSLGGVSLLLASEGDLIEFSDGQGSQVQVQNPGSAAQRYGSGQALDGLAPLSLANVDGLGTGSWSLQATARAASGILTDFQIGSLSIDYTVALPEPSELLTDGLALHLDAGTLSGLSDGAALSSGWSDWSGSGLTASSPEPPLYVSDGGSGYPAVRFDGVDDYLQVDLATGNELSVFAVFAQRRATALANYRDTLLSGAGGGSYLSLASSRSAATPPAMPSFNALTGNGVSVQTWMNGHDTADVTGDFFPNRYSIASAVYTHVPAETALFIGAQDSNGFHAGQNDIRELLVYDRELTDAERLEVQAYLAEKYQIDAITRAPEHPVESYTHPLGSQQFGQQYSFGASDCYVLDYARDTLRQGNSVIKFRLSNRYNSEDGFTQLSGINSLTKLVRDHPQVQEVLDLPLTDYLFWVSTFSVPKWQDKAKEIGSVGESSWTAFYGANRSLYAVDTYDEPGKSPTPLQGLDPTAAQQIYTEIYDLTVYLLQTYSGTGKSFYIGNWEGDWMLSATNTYVDQNMPPERLQAMIDWANTRQQAIDAAKAATPHSDVNVWFYLEANKMDWARNEQICVTNSVIPAMPKLDFLSFSAYSLHKTGNGLTKDAASMHTDLDLLQARIDAKPDPSISGSRLIIGEYGYLYGNPEPGASDNRFSDFYDYTQEHVSTLRNFLSWQGGTLRFLLQWQFYSRQMQTKTNAAGQVVQYPYEMCHISEQQEIRPLYYLHANFYAGMRQWVANYYQTQGSLPTDRAYADAAYHLLGGISLNQDVPDLSNPRPGRIELQGSASALIPEAAGASLVLPYTATVFSHYGRIMPNEQALTWSLQPQQQGVSVDSAGELTVFGNASPDTYTLSASLNANPSISTAQTLAAVFPVASTYDHMADFSQSFGVNPELSIASSNAATRFEGDSGRVTRTSSTSPQAIVWEVSDLQGFHAKVYTYGSLGAALTAEVSADGVGWQSLSLRVDPATPTADGWQRTWIAPAAPLPEGSNYLRLVLQDPNNAWSPQLGQLVLFGAETGYNFWRAQQFPDSSDAANPDISGPDADPLQSGISNLYRYFAGLPLSGAGQDRLPRLENSAGEWFYRIPFDPTKLDVRAVVKGSLDLQSWDYTVFDSAMDTAELQDGWLWLTADQLPASDSKFFKLDLSL
ncbi:MAG: hypothetical protein ACPGCS_00055 [Opitutales bacterium]